MFLPFSKINFEFDAVTNKTHVYRVLNTEDILMLITVTLIKITHMFST